MIDMEFALAVDYDMSFSQTDAPEVIKNFVCGVCHGELTEVFIPNEGRVLVVCLEHGNVCNCGRVTRATVGIQLEQGYRAYHEVIRNLPDLWGHLIDTGFEREKAHLIWKNFVCAVGGEPLNMQFRADDPKGNRVDLVCPQHGNIDICGFVRKENFKYNYQAIRAWEKEHRKNYSQ